MRRFADWASTKEWVFIDEEHPENEIYLESGCPKYALLQLIEEGWKIFITDGKKVKAIRDRDFVGEEKTDELDARCIQILFHENPDAFKEFEKPQQLALKRNRLVKQYVAVTKEIVRQTNRRKAFVKEFGPGGQYDEPLQQIEEAKQQMLKVMKKVKISLLKRVTPLIKNELSLVNSVKGVGPTFTAVILGTAHPNRFKSKSAYLKYLGFIDKNNLSEEDKHKRNRLAKSTFWNIANCTIKAKDPYFYSEFYLQTREKYVDNLCTTCPSHKKPCKVLKRTKEDPSKRTLCKNRIHAIALNRLSTALAKYFYTKLKDVRFNDVSEWLE